MERLNIEIPDERAYMHDDPELGIVKTDPENKHWPRMIMRYKKCIQLTNFTGGKWLDIACGSGYGTELISEVADYVTGFDIDTKTIKYAKKHHKIRQNIEFINQDILNPSVLENSSFDVIISVETIEHLNDAKPFLNRIYQLLKIGGIFIVTTPESQFGGGKNPYNKFHLNEYTLDQVRAILNLFFHEVIIKTEKAIFTTGLQTLQIYARCNKKL